MIENELQYITTMKAILKFQEALIQLYKDGVKDTNPILYKAQVDSITSQIDELREQTNTYENHQKGHIN